MNGLKEDKKEKKIENRSAQSKLKYKDWIKYSLKKANSVKTAGSAYIWIVHPGGEQSTLIIGTLNRIECAWKLNRDINVIFPENVTANFDLTCN